MIYDLDSYKLATPNNFDSDFEEIENEMDIKGSLDLTPEEEAKVIEDDFKEIVDYYGNDKIKVNHQINNRYRIVFFTTFFGGCDLEELQKKGFRFSNCQMSIEEPSQTKIVFTKDI